MFYNTTINVAVVVVIVSHRAMAQTQAEQNGTDSICYSLHKIFAQRSPVLLDRNSSAFLIEVNNMWCR